MVLKALTFDIFSHFIDLYINLCHLYIILIKFLTACRINAPLKIVLSLSVWLHSFMVAITRWWSEIIRLGGAACFIIRSAIVKFYDPFYYLIRIIRALGEITLSSTNRLSQCVLGLVWNVRLKFWKVEGLDFVFMMLKFVMLWMCSFSKIFLLEWFPVIGKIGIFTCTHAQIVGR